MPDGDLADQLTAAAQRLASTAPAGVVHGRDVAREVGRDPADPALHDAFAEIARRGELTLGGTWEADKSLPPAIGFPRMN